MENQTLQQTKINSLQVYNPLVKFPLSNRTIFNSKEEVDEFLQNTKAEWFVKFVSSSITKKGFYKLDFIMKSAKADDIENHFSFYNRYRVLKMEKIEGTNTWHATYEFNEWLG